MAINATLATNLADAMEAAFDGHSTNTDLVAFRVALQHYREALEMRLASSMIPCLFGPLMFHFVDPKSSSSILFAVLVTFCPLRSSQKTFLNLILLFLDETAAKIQGYFRKF